MQRLLAGGGDVTDQQVLGLADPEVVRRERVFTTCCGALDLGDSYEGGRPYQCLCQWTDRPIEEERA